MLHSGPACCTTTVMSWDTWTFKMLRLQTLCFRSVSSPWAASAAPRRVLRRWQSTSRLTLHICFVWKWKWKWTEICLYELGPSLNLLFFVFHFHQNLSYGQTKEFNCEHCHGKLSILAESTRFQYIQPRANKAGQSSPAFANKGISDGLWSRKQNAPVGLSDQCYLTLLFKKLQDAWEPLNMSVSSTCTKCLLHLNRPGRPIYRVFYFYCTGPSACAVHYKLIRDPAVQKGKPLPEKGACKHYKQSHRWLRYHSHCVLCHFTRLTWKLWEEHIVKALCHRLPSGFLAVDGRTLVMCAMMKTRTTPWNWPPGWSVATVPKNRWATDLKYALARELILLSRQQRTMPLSHRTKNPLTLICQQLWLYCEMLCCFKFWNYVRLMLISKYSHAFSLFTRAACRIAIQAGNLKYERVPCVVLFGSVHSFIKHIKFSSSWKHE